MKPNNTLQIPKRSHFYGSKYYLTGFERMLTDKWVLQPGILKKVSVFALFGLVNAFCYGLSHMMSEKDYLYYFSYKANGRYTDLIRSNFGCNNLASAIWTVPSLIFFGQYMTLKKGPIVMTKFTALACLSVLAWQSAFSPSTE